MLLFQDSTIDVPVPLKPQLLKWIGNKHRFALEIVSYFPARFSTYFEPFLGAGPVLATLRHLPSVGSDSFRPLIDVWKTLKAHPETLKSWYSERWRAFVEGDRIEEYQKIRASYNADPNPADLLFLCRACYGGVVRFRKADGHMSTPCGPHHPISPESFARRVDEWHERVRKSQFECMDYREAMRLAKPGDLVYCDPPYSHSQAILYGAQDFSIRDLFDEIARCKTRGVFVALSIDGKKRSGRQICRLPTPEGLFEREAFIDCGRSMLKRLQMNGRSLEGEVVADRLLLTY